MPSADGTLVAYTRHDPFDTCVTHLMVMDHDGQNVAPTRRRCCWSARFRRTRWAMRPWTPAFPPAPIGYTPAPMNRPRTLRHFVLLLVLPLVAACSGGGGPDAPRKNLLLIAVDTLRADRLGSYGYQRGTSPALDALFDQSVVFEEAHSASSWTLPSFASIMTSLYSTSHGCWQFDSKLDDSFTTMAELLADAGFHTAAVVSHVFLGRRHGLHQGFERYDESLVYSAEKSHEAVSSPPVTERALAFLDRKATQDDGQPWFLWVHLFDPHSVYQEHEGVTERFGSAETDLYDGEIAFTDQHIGRLLARVDERGLAENTVVVFLVDHGEEFEDHGRILHGRTLYQEVTRIPLAIRAPGFAARRVDHPVGGVDVLPTVLELLSVPEPDLPMAGRSLVPLMRGEVLDDQALLLESRLDLRGDVDLSGLVLGRWKLIVETPKSREQGDQRKVMLFDRRSDPAEAEDLAEVRPDVVGKMAARLKAAVAAARTAGKMFTVGEAQPLSAEDIEELRALGYVGGDGE